MAVTEAHLRALGRVTVNFSTLEFTLVALVAGLSAPDNLGVGQILGPQLSFARLVTAVDALFRLRRPGSPDIGRLAALLARASAAEERRNVVVHSAYLVADGTPADIVTRFKLRAKRDKGLSHDAQDTTPADIEQVASELHTVSTDLARFIGETGLLPTM